MNTQHDSLRLSPLSPAVLTRAVTLVALAGIALGGVVAVIFLQDRRHEAALLRQQGIQRVDRESEFLAGEIETVRSDVLYLAEQEALQRFLAGDEDARSELSREYARFAARRAIYDQIRFLDAAGKEIIRVNYRRSQAEIVPADELQAKDDRYYYREALKLKPGEVFVSEFDLNVEHGQIEQPLNPVLRFLTPVVGADGATRGLLVLNYSGDHLLQRLNELSLPGATLLVNLAGEYVQGPAPEDAWGWLLGHPRSFPRQFPSAWPHIKDEPAGQFANAEGLFTFRRVSLSGDVPVRDQNRRTETEAPDPLILITHVPPALQYATSTKLLKQLLWIYAGAMTLLVIFGSYWARSSAIRKRQDQSIAASETRLRTLSEQLLSAQEEERRNISRELHDELGQQVTAISLDLRSAARHEDPARARSRLERAIQETDHLLKTVHEVATRVRPSVLDDLGLHDAIESLASEIGGRTGVTVNACLDFAEERVSPKVGENVYRIVHEGLINIVKHAETTEASVTITDAQNELHVTLADFGVGFDPQQRDDSRLGLLGMQERTELLGGRFTLSSAPGAGTRIDIQIPLKNARM